jgi:hypothetical protein
MLSRASSSAACAARPARCTDDGLAQCAAAAVIAATAAGSIGAVAA